MDENACSNYARLIGTLDDAPRYSHSSRGEDFFVFPLRTERLSGTADTVNVIARRSLLDAVEVSDAGRISVEGELRSFNNKSGDGAKLVISVFAKNICLCGAGDLNLICLTGTLCKSPNLRVTPMGRDICDLMLAVNRRYGRSDYLPCIAWGLKARRAALFDVGTVVSITGRLQSRSYIKIVGGEPQEKTAFEVSVTDIEEAELP